MRYINGINLIINKGFSTEIGIYLICTKFSFNEFFFIEYADIYGMNRISICDILME